MESDDAIRCGSGARFHCVQRWPLGTGLSEQAGKHHRAVHRRQRDRHPGAQHRPETLRDVGPAGRRREPARRGRHDRCRQSWRSRRRTATRCWCIRRRRRSTRRSTRACRTTRQGLRRGRTARRAAQRARGRAGDGHQARRRSHRAAKQKPGALNFGSAGTGSGTHINGEKFKLAAGIDVVHIPYKGTPEALTDTIAGRVTYFFSPISAALPIVREGKLVALGVSTAKRSGALPNVPTIAEAGLPGFDYNLWVGMFAPAGTPNDIVDKINARRGARARDSRDERALRGAGCRADGDDAGRIPQVHARRDGGLGQGREGGRDQGAVGSPTGDAHLLHLPVGPPASTHDTLPQQAPRGVGLLIRHGLAFSELTNTLAFAQNDKWRKTMTNLYRSLFAAAILATLPVVGASAQDNGTVVLASYGSVWQEELEIA